MFSRSNVFVAPDISFFKTFFPCKSRFANNGTAGYGLIRKHNSRIYNTVTRERPKNVLATTLLKTNRNAEKTPSKGKPKRYYLRRLIVTAFTAYKTGPEELSYDAKDTVASVVRVIAEHLRLINTRNIYSTVARDDRRSFRLLKKSYDRK